MVLTDNRAAGWFSSRDEMVADTISEVRNVPNSDDHKPKYGLPSLYMCWAYTPTE